MDSNLFRLIYDFFKAISINTSEFLKDKFGWEISPVFIQCLAASLVLIIFYCFNRIRKTNKWRRELIEERLGTEFRLYSKQKLNFLKRIWLRLKKMSNFEIYIETRFQKEPPHEKQDPEENNYTEPSESLMKFYLEKVLVKDNTSPFLYCVLGGSGMGKTTFAINLFKKYINKYTENTKPFDIYIYNLGNNSVFDKIKDIKREERPKSILILDALDENTNAVHDYDCFIKQLEDLIQEFRIVIITCRTQFFDEEKKEPNKSSLSYYNGNRTFEHYNTHYISVFNGKDIKKYLKKKYLFQFNKRKKAASIVSKCKSLMVRPLLLSRIDDLLQEKEEKLSTVTHIYETLIEKWIDREVEFWETKNKNQSNTKNLKMELYRFSEQLAKEIYERKDKNGGLFIPKDDLASIITDNNYTNYDFKGRSLVNRDRLGNIKFSHKSFLEYFLAKQMFEEKIPVSFEGMDMAKTFYHELCDMEMERLIKEGVITCYNPKGNGACFVINKAIKFYNKTHNERFSESTIFISWEAVNDVLFSWLEPLEAIRLVFFNYQNNQHNIDVLDNFLSKPMNREKTSLYFWGDIIEVFRGFDDKNFSQCKLRIINKTEINSITPEVIKLTLNSLLSNNKREYNNWIIIDNKIYRLVKRT
ncbi:MAG: hypothetical protein J6P77_03715 [Acetobacter sp.]|nr:hypothetical protein [Acetobacter sp.]